MRPKTPGRDAYILHYLTLRKVIGWLGVALPAAMVLGNLILKGCTSFQDTISHYYYTITGDLFVGILCGVALFLLSYKGYDRLDHISTSLAGVFALCIAFFPTYNNSSDSCAVFHLPRSPLSNTIHYVSAGAFFLLLAFISLFLFTKSCGVKTRQKETRNLVYRTCGIIILIAVILIGIYKFNEESLSPWASYKPVFWLEWLALLAFGMSWLVKGKLLFSDDENEHRQPML